MERWQGKVALVTGASQGMGRAISSELVKSGMIVYGCARSVNKLEDLQNELKGAKGKFFPVACDLSDERSILNVFDVIERNSGALHVVLNVAGVIKNSTLLDAPTNDWRESLDVMVLAPAIIQREGVKLMRKHKIDDGHIINISSMAPYAFPPLPFLHFPAGVKCMVLALTRGLRHELLAAKSKIRVSAISPGTTATGAFDQVTPGGPGPQGGGNVMEGMPALKASDIASTVKFILSADPGANVFDVLIQPTGGF